MCVFIYFFQGTLDNADIIEFKGWTDEHQQEKVVKEGTYEVRKVVCLK